MSSFHAIWGQVAVGIGGVVGLWGVFISRRDTPPRVFYWAVGVAIVGLLTQVITGVVLMQSE
ncbi:MAG TPA: hypothetical protein VIG24_15290, partial [Acidimicrobiia bacterium]